MNQTPRTSSDPLVSTAHGAGPQFARPLLPTGPILLWLIVQAAALAIAALRIPLWAQPPAAQELLASKIVTIVQIGTSALLFPMLMRTWPLTIATIATSWPMVALAGLLAAADVRTIIYFGSYVTTWLAVLALLRANLRSATFELIAVAAVSLWTIGGPFLLFAAQEYGSGSRVRGMQYMLSPVLTVAGDAPQRLDGWASIGIVGLLALLWTIARFLLQRRYRAGRS